MGSCWNFSNSLIIGLFKGLQILNLHTLPGNPRHDGCGVLVHSKAVPALSQRADHSGSNVTTWCTELFPGPCLCWDSVKNSNRQRALLCNYIHHSGLNACLHVILVGMPEGLCLIKTTGFLYLILWRSFKLFEGMSATGFVKYKRLI